MRPNLNCNFHSPLSTALPDFSSLTAKMLSPKREATLSRDQLLDYYRATANNFERERTELQQKLDAVAGTDNQRHQLRFELQRAIEQVADLQRSLSDAHMQLYEEKERVVTLQSEHFELNSQSLLIPLDQLNSLQTSTRSAELASTI